MLNKQKYTSIKVNSYSYKKKKTKKKQTPLYGSTKYAEANN